MDCLRCQRPLVSVPTAQHPQVDVCPEGHGIWLDAAEINFFIDDYKRLTDELRARDAAGAPAGGLCGRCGSRLVASDTGTVEVLTCASCQGAWWPQGQLTRAHEVYRRGAVHVELDEAALFRRAAQRQREVRRPRRPTHSPSTLWLWGLLAALLGVFVIGLLVHQATAVLGRLAWVAPPDQLFGYLLLGVPGGVVLFVYGFTLTRRVHLIESLPTSTIRSLAVGPVEIRGTAVAAAPLESAPFSQTSCVFYAWKVEEQQQAGRSKRWVTVAEGRSDPPFSLEDATGRVMVVPLGAELLLEDRHTVVSHWWRGLGPTVEDGLARLGVTTSAGRAVSRRCTEWVIRPGRNLYVLGVAHPRPVAEPVFDNAARLYIGSGRDREFLIADRGEPELLQYLRWRMWGALLAGPALSVGCLMALASLYVRF